MLSICINTRDEGPRLRRTVDEFTANMIGAEVAICADGKVGQTLDGLSPDILIRNARPEGCGKAKRALSREASGDVMLFADAHHALVAGSLHDLYDVARLRRAVVCPAIRAIRYTDDLRVETVDDVLQVPAEVAIGWPRADRRQYRPATVTEMALPIYEGLAPGVCATMSRATLDAIGGWNRYAGLHGSQERGLGLRAFMARVPVCICPHVVVGHEFRTLNTSPYPPAPRSHATLNLWHALFAVTERHTFVRYLMPRLLELPGAKRGLQLFSLPEAREDRAHYHAHCKRRDDGELLELLDLLEKR